MDRVIDIKDKDRKDYNKVVSHPLQSFEWGEFRKKTGIKVVRKGIEKNGKIIDGFTLTLHNVPYTNYKIGYLPKGNFPNKVTIRELERIGKEENCIFIQLEPNVVRDQKSNIKGQKDLEFEFDNLGLKPSVHPLFTKYTFILDITKSEEELLKNMHPKTRYNIKVAQKHGVWIEKDNSEESFKTYLKLLNETTNRQGFYAHTNFYHRTLWEMMQKNDTGLKYYIFHAKYKSEDKKIHTLVSWVVFIFHDTIYYPYGASTSQFREVMASNLIMWDVIKFGRSLGLLKFDMWGALGPEPSKNDPWYGFHRFKLGYGGSLAEFAGSFDLIINSNIYRMYKIADIARWSFLRIKKRIF